jgi:hypothetical protein
MPQDNDKLKAILKEAASKGATDEQLRQIILAAQEKSAPRVQDEEVDPDKIAASDPFVKEALSKDDPNRILNDATAVDQQAVALPRELLEEQSAEAKRAKAERDAIQKEKATLGTAASRGELNRQIGVKFDILTEGVERKPSGVGTAAGPVFLTEEVTPERRFQLISEISELSKQRDDIPVGEAVDEFNKIVADPNLSTSQKILSITSEAMSVEGIKGLAQMNIESISASPQSFMLGIMGAGTPIGRVVAGATGSFSAESVLALEQGFNDSGIDVSDPKQLAEAFSNPELIKTIRENAQKRGAAVAAVDALFSFGAGQLAKSQFKNAGVDLALEFAGEAGGEFSGQIAADEETNVSGAFLEGLTSFAQSASTSAAAKSTSLLKNTDVKIEPDTEPTSQIDRDGEGDRGAETEVSRPDGGEPVPGPEAAGDPLRVDVTEDPDATTRDDVRDDRGAEGRPSADDDAGRRSGRDVIFDNDAIFTNEPRQTKANIEPELSDKSIKAISNEKVKAEAERIVSENDIDSVEKAIKDPKNGMHPSLRRQTAVEAFKQLKNVDRARAEKILDINRETGTEAAQAVQVGQIVREDPEVIVAEIRKNVRDKNKEVLKSKNLDGDTVDKQIKNELKEVKKIARDAGVKVSKSDSIKSIVKKIIDKQAPQKQTKPDTDAKIKASKQKIKKIRADRKKLIDDFKNKKNDLLLSSAIPGLSPKGIEHAINLSKSYIQEGLANADIILQKIKQVFNDSYGIQLNEEDERVILEGIENQDLGKVLKKNLTQSGIQSVVNSHFGNIDKAKSALVDKITSTFDISESDALKISEMIEDAVDKEVRKNLTRMLGTTRLKQQRKPKKNEIQKAMDAITSGSLNEELYRSLFAERFGLSQITQEDISTLEKFAEDINSSPSEALRKRLMLDFSSALEDMKKKDESNMEDVWDTALNVWYASILSGPSTQARAGKGALMTSAANAMAAAITNPVATFQGLRGIMAFWNGLNRFGISQYKQILKDGYSDIDFFDVQPNKRRKLDKFVEGEIDLKFGNVAAPRAVSNAARKFYTPIVFFNRNLIAMDAILKSGIQEYEAYIAEYNNYLADGKSTRRFGPREAKMFNDINESLGNTRDQLDQFRQIAKAEKEELVKKGVKIPPTFEKLRFQELINEARDQEVVKQAHRNAAKAVLMGDPEGGLGVLFRGINNALTINESDSKTFKTAKFLGRSIFPFMRVATNFVNTQIDYSPIGGLLTLVGDGKIKTREGYRQRTPEEAQRAYAKAALGTAAAMTLASGAFEWDEEDGFKLNSDPWFEVTGQGTGDFVKNKSISEDFKQWSFRIKNPITGKWSPRFSYLDSPIGGMIAPLGILSDDIRFGDFAKRVEEKGGEIDDARRDIGALMWSYVGGFTDFATEQSYSQGLNTLLEFINGDIEMKVDEGQKLLTNPIKGILLPNLYKQMHQQYQAYRQIPIKEATTVRNRLLRDIPLAEQIINGELIDQFGYPVTRKFSPPTVPDFIIKPALDIYGERDKKKEWQEVYKFQEVTVGKGFRPPKELKGKDREDWLRTIGLEFRKEFNKISDKDKEDPIQFQIEINRARTKALREGKKKFKSSR